MNVDLKISDLLTLPNTILAALSLASGLILFLPKFFLEKMYLLDFRGEYGFIIGLVFLFAFSILVINSIYTATQTLTEKRNKKKFYDEAENRLKSLNNYQKSIIYFLYLQDNLTSLLPLHDGAVLALEQKMMIGKATSQYMVEDLNNAQFPYLLQTWVADELNAKPNLVQDLLQASENGN